MPFELWRVTLKGKDHHQNICTTDVEEMSDIWDLLCSMGMVACPELTAIACPALGVRCERFEGYLRLGPAGFGIWGGQSAQQKCHWPATA